MINYEALTQRKAVVGLGYSSNKYMIQVTHEQMPQGLL